MISYKQSLSEGEIRLCIMLAGVDDEWVERWASQFGLTRRPPYNPGDGLPPLIQETMAEFRARCIETMSKEVTKQIAPEVAASLLEEGLEIDICTGDPV